MMKAIEDAAAFIVRSVSNLTFPAARKRLSALCSGLAVEFENAAPDRSWHGKVWEIVEAAWIAGRLGFDHPPIVLTHDRSEAGVEITAAVHAPGPGEVLTITCSRHLAKDAICVAWNDSLTQQQRDEIVRRLRRWSHDAAIVERDAKAWKMKPNKADQASLCLAATYDIERGLGVWPIAKWSREMQAKEIADRIEKCDGGRIVQPNVRSMKSALQSMHSEITGRRKAYRVRLDTMSESDASHFPV